jgi:RHS repeat-associated protein
MAEGDGLYYVRARYYDSSAGRFLSRDFFLGSDTVPGSLHRYAYVQNNPLNWIDPAGLCAEKDIKFVGDFLQVAFEEVLQEGIVAGIETLRRGIRLYGIVPSQDILKTTPQTFINKISPHDLGISIGVSFVGGQILDQYSKHFEGDKGKTPILIKLGLIGIGATAAYFGAPAAVIAGAVLTVEGITGRVHEVGGDLDPNNPEEALIIKAQSGN